MLFEEEVSVCYTCNILNFIVWNAYRLSAGMKIIFSLWYLEETEIICFIYNYKWFKTEWMNFSCFVKFANFFPLVLLSCFLKYVQRYYALFSLFSSVTPSGIFSDQSSMSNQKRALAMLWSMDIWIYQHISYITDLFSGT